MKIVCVSECDFCEEMKGVGLGPYDNYICEECSVVFAKEEGLMEQNKNGGVK